MFENVSPGGYVVWAEAQGFVWNAPDYERVAPRSRIVTMTADNAVRDLALPLTPTAVISGRVRNENGDPVPSAVVRLYQYHYGPNGVRMETAQSAIADDHGDYRISDVAPGRCYLGVHRYIAPPNAVGRIHRSVPERGFGNTFYPGVDRASEAAAIEVAAGAQLTGTDLQMHRVRVFHIRGRLVDAATGQGAQGDVETDTCAGTDPPFRSLSSRPDGSFDLWGMVPSAYCLSASVKSASGVLRATRKVLLNNQDIGDITLTLEPALTLQGTASIEGTAPDQLERTRFTLTEIGGSGESSAVIGPGGAFKVPNLAAGAYRIGIEYTAARLYLKTLRQGSKDLSADGQVDVAAGAVPLELVFAADGGQLSGSISGNGSGLAPVAVTLAPAEDFAGRRDLVRTVDPADASGAFRIRRCRARPLSSFRLGTRRHRVGRFAGVSRPTREPGDTRGDPCRGAADRATRPDPGRRRGRSAGEAALTWEVFCDRSADWRRASPRNCGDRESA